MQRFIASVTKELDATISSFCFSLANPSLSQASTSESLQGSQLIPVVEAQVVPPTQEGRFPSYSPSHSKEEEEEGVGGAPSKYKLSLKQVQLCS